MHSKLMVKVKQVNDKESVWSNWLEKREMGNEMAFWIQMNNWERIRTAKLIERLAFFWRRRAAKTDCQNYSLSRRAPPECTHSLVATTHATGERNQAVGWENEERVVCSRGFLAIRRDHFEVYFFTLKTQTTWLEDGKGIGIWLMYVFFGWLQKSICSKTFIGNDRKKNKLNNSQGNRLQGSYRAHTTEH